MGNIFGRKRRPTRETEQDGAALQLKQQLDKLKQYQKKIRKQQEKARLLATKLLQDGKREKALLLLKKKRYQDQLLDKTENQISNLERMVLDIEFAQIEMEVIEALKVGNDYLKKMHKVMSIEEKERIMDEIQDAIEYQRQIDDMLAGPLTQEDEDAVLAELEALTQGEKRRRRGRTGVIMEPTSVLGKPNSMSLQTRRPQIQTCTFGPAHLDPLWFFWPPTGRL